MVQDPDAYAGVVLPEFFQYGKEYAVQGDFACRHGNDSGLQAPVSGDLLLSAHDMLKRDQHMSVQLFPLGRQADSVSLSHKEGTAQLFLQLFHHAGNIGLIIEERAGGAGKALVFRNIVEHLVVLIVNVHFVLPYQFYISRLHY